MENDYLVNEFLDGTLDSAGEDRFFSMLSSESELRNEFKQQLAIKNAIRGDIRAFTPKAESTMQIFDKLGLVVPVLPLASPAPVIGTFAKFAGMMKLGAGYLVAGALSALITAIALFSIYDFGKDNSSNLQNVLSDRVFKTHYSDFANHTQDSNESLSKVADSKQDEPNIVYKYIYVKSEGDITDSHAAPQDLSSTNTTNDGRNELNIISSDIINSNSRFDKISNNTNISSNSNLPYLNGFSLNNSSITENGSLMLELRASEYMGTDIKGIMPSDDLGLINSSFAISYKLDNEFSFGIDYRRERFAQEFTGKEGNNYFVYRQEPNFQTISLFAKYNPEILKYEVFSPFTILSLGANSSGPVGRIMLGTDIYFSNKFYFTIGYDYNTLFYTQSGANFISSKTGYHFGAGIKF